MGEVSSEYESREKSVYFKRLSVRRWAAPPDAPDIDAVPIDAPELPLLDYRMHGNNTILRGAARNHLEAAHLLRSAIAAAVSGA